MAIVAGDVLTMCRTALLNDPSGAIYPDTAMYPVLNLAYRRLQTKCAAMGIGTNKEIWTPPIEVAAGVTELIDGAGLPTDIVYPTFLSERPDGSTGQFIPMEERSWEPEEIQTNELRFWVWREESIKFLGALTAREVRIKGVKSLGSLTNTNSPVLILNSEPWLAQQAAVIAAVTIGANPKRAELLAEDLVDLWDDFKATLNKRKQAVPVRRRRTRYRVM